MKRINFFIVVLLTSTIACAQEHKLYSGGFQGGEAKYSYYETDYGRIFDGDFHWKKKVTLPLAGYSTAEIEMERKFKQDRRDGLWVYKEIRNSETLGKLKINYVDGIKEGTCEYEGAMFYGIGANIHFQTTYENGRWDGTVICEWLGPNNTIKKTIKGEYIQDRRTGVWEGRYLNGSYFHIENHSREDSERDTQLKGNFFFNNEDGSKTPITENDALEKFEDNIQDYIIRWLEGRGCDFDRGLRAPKVIQQETNNSSSQTTHHNNASTQAPDQQETSSQNKPNGLKGKFMKFLNMK